MQREDNKTEKPFYTDEELIEIYNYKIKEAKLNNNTESFFYYQSLLMMLTNKKDSDHQKFLSKDLFKPMEK